MSETNDSTQSKVDSHPDIEFAYSNSSIGEIPQIEDLPPSSKLVFKMLQYNGEMKMAELIEETLLCERTTHFAVNRLIDAEVIDERPCLQDARQEIYFIHPEHISKESSRNATSLDREASKSHE